jgi:hypothetical protein
MKLSPFRPFVFVISLIILVSLACGSAPTAVSNPVTEAPVTEAAMTEAPVTEAPATEPPMPEAQQYFTEEWDGDLSNWSKEVYQNADEGDTREANIGVEDGRLVFDFGKWLIGYVFYNPYEYDNVRIDARVDNRGTNVNNVLLVCRASDEGLYLINIANSGLFAMYAYDGVKQEYKRIADGGSKNIKPGKEVNDYGLECNDRTLTIYINGKKVRDYTDNDFVFRKGQIGVGVASEDQVPVKLEFENVTISEP